MLETNAERLSFKNQILQELSEHSGGPWKEVYCEAHPQFNEMVFWVLLYEDSNLKETHKLFCGILAPHIENMKPLEAFLSYQRFTDEGRHLVERLKGNEAIFSALKKDKLEGSAIHLGETTGVFRSTDSKR